MTRVRNILWTAPEKVISNRNTVYQVCPSRVTIVYEKCCMFSTNFFFGILFIQVSEHLSTLAKRQFNELLKYSNTLTFCFSCCCYIAWCLTSGGFVLGFRCWRFLGENVRKLSSILTNNSYYQRQNTSSDKSKNFPLKVIHQKYAFQVTVFSFSKPKEQKHQGNTLVKLTTCTMLHSKNKTPTNLKGSHILYIQYILPLCLKHRHLAWQWMYLSNQILIR